MKKVLYAIGHEDTENALTEEVKSEYEVVGTVIYKEALIGHLEQTRPDIVILREGLPGSLPILDLTYTIRAQMPDIRIIFIAEEKLPGDSLLAALVSFGIYDILASDKIRLSEIVDCIRRPRTLGEAAMFQTPFSGAQHGKHSGRHPRQFSQKRKNCSSCSVIKGIKQIKTADRGLRKK
jgi:DNA-binding NarL/FixJ family response regulator